MPPRYVERGVPVPLPGTDTQPGSPVDLRKSVSSLEKVPHQKDLRVRVPVVRPVPPPTGLKAVPAGEPTEDRRSKAELAKLHAVLPGAIAGSERETTDLIRIIQPMVLKFCRARMGRQESVLGSADDVAQEVVLAVLRALPTYVEKGLSFRAFVYGIASHKVTDAFRAMGRNKSDPVGEMPDDSVTYDGPEQQFLRGEQSDRLGELLNELTDKQKEVVVLREVVGLSAEETAKVVGSTPGAVRVTQHRALGRLRKLINGNAPTQDTPNEQEERNDAKAVVEPKSEPRQSEHPRTTSELDFRVWVRLSDTDRNVLSAHDAGLGPAAIAQQLGLPQKEVRGALSKARANYAKAKKNVNEPFITRDGEIHIVQAAESETVTILDEAHTVSIPLVGVFPPPEAEPDPSFDIHYVPYPGELPVYDFSAQSAPQVVIDELHPVTGPLTGDLPGDPVEPDPAFITRTYTKITTSTPAYTTDFANDGVPLSGPVIVQMDEQPQEQQIVQRKEEPSNENWWSRLAQDDIRASVREYILAMSGKEHDQTQPAETLQGEDLDTALLFFTEDQRRALSLYYGEGLTYTQIGKELKISHQQAKYRVRHFKSDFNQMISGNIEDTKFREHSRTYEPAADIVHEFAETVRRLGTRGEAELILAAAGGGSFEAIAKSIDLPAHWVMTKLDRARRNIFSKMVEERRAAETVQDVADTEITHVEREATQGDKLFVALQLLAPDEITAFGIKFGEQMDLTDVPESSRHFRTSEIASLTTRGKRMLDEITGEQFDYITDIQGVALPRQTPEQENRFKGTIERLFEPTDADLLLDAARGMSYDQLRKKYENALSSKTVLTHLNALRKTAYQEMLAEYLGAPEKPQQVLAEVIQLFPATEVLSAEQEALAAKWDRAITLLPYRRAIQALHIASGLKLKEYAAAAGLSESAIIGAKDGRSVHPANLKKLFEASGLSAIDTNGSIEQMLYLKNAGRNVMTRAEFDNSAFGDLVTYFRILKGGTLEDIERDTAFSMSLANNIETFKSEPDSEFARAFVGWLGLSTDSPVAQAMMQKIFHPAEQVSDQLWESMRGDKYLLADRQVRSFDDESFDEAMKLDIAAGAALKEEREKHGLNQTQLGNRVGKYQAFISTVERGVQVPEDTTLVLLASGLGHALYDADRFVWKLIVTAEQQRKGRENLLGRRGGLRLA